MNDNFMKEKPGRATSGIYGPADGAVHACEFTVQYCGQLFCGQKSVNRP